MTTPLFPLSAVAHQPELVLALSLLAVSPEIGGVLIRGDRGAAKSTAARGLAALFPDGGPFVNLPLGATEDRVVGTLDLDAALRGEARLKPGLMAQAHGGLLYIDEVNLLPDHLVDVLLDAAAMGVVRVQRDSLSAEAPARFALVGSMNPEEGQLRPQFLDRFGLCVDVLAPRGVAERAEIVRRRVAFEADAAAFAARWQPSEAELRGGLERARQLLPQVTLPDALLDVIAGMTTAAGVRSLRADLVLHRAARAHAALQGHLQVTSGDLQRVAPLVLRHRQEPRQSAPPAPSQPPQTQPPQTQPPQTQPPQPQPPQPSPEPSPEAAAEPASESPGKETPPAGEQRFAPTAAAPLPLAPQAQAGAWGGGAREGRLIRTVSDPQAARLHLPATLLQAARRGGEFALQREDFQTPVHETVGGRRVLFVADASGSVGVSGRMGAVKAAMLDVLREQGRRDRVALITFRGTGAALLLDWTNDAEAAEHAIGEALTGGRTPLAHALHLAAGVLAGQPQAQLVLFTDGRANVPLTAGSDAWTDALSAATALRLADALVVDTEVGNVRLGRAGQLAEVLRAKCVSLLQM